MADFLSRPEGLASKLVGNARARARTLGLEFTLTNDDIVPALVRGRCAVTGIAFQNPNPTERRGFRPFSPSLDRIDRSRGYTPDNIQVVVWIFNLAKGPFKESDVMTMAKALVASRRPKTPKANLIANADQPALFDRHNGFGGERLASV